VRALVETIPKHKKSDRKITLILIFVAGTAPIVIGGTCVRQLADMSPTSYRFKNSFLMNSLPLADFNSFSLLIASALVSNCSEWINSHGLNLIVHPLVANLFMGNETGIQIRRVSNIDLVVTAGV
jgi:hypothetical protein